MRYFKNVVSSTDTEGNVTDSLTSMTACTNAQSGDVEISKQYYSYLKMAIDWAYNGKHLDRDTDDPTMFGTDTISQADDIISNYLHEYDDSKFPKHV